MRFWRELTFILRHLNRRRGDAMLDDEIRSHLEMETDDNVDSGMSPGEAKRAANLAFGSVSISKEDSRATWGLASIDRASQDVRYALRLLVKNPAFSFIAVATLALGIGANTAIFSVVNAVLIKPLPYPSAERLVTLRSNQSLPDLDDLKRVCTSFQAMGGVVIEGLDYTGASEPVQVQAAECNSDVFPALGVQPLIGRVITPEDDRFGGPQAAVLSYSLWQSRFAGDPSVLGRAITLSGNSYTIIGVMPSDFSLPREKADLFVSLKVAYPAAAKVRGVHFLRTYLRLKDGITLAQAAADIHSADNWLETHYPSENKNRRSLLTPLKTRVIGDSRPALLILFGAVSLVLLISSANFAGLLLARGSARHSEIVIRSALGARRARLIHQMLIESLLLSLMGGACGVGIAALGLKLLVALKPASLPRLAEVGLDLRVLSFTLLVSLIAGILFGLPPAFTASKANAGESLREVSRSATAGRLRGRIRSVLVTCEIALALVLLIGAGLLVRGLLLLTRVDPGFDPQNLLTMRLELPETRYREIPTQTAFRTALLDDLNGQPGLGAAMVSELPCSGDYLTHNFVMEGWPQMSPAESPELQTRSVSRDYFNVMRIPLLMGRNFKTSEDANAPMVGLVNQAFVRTYLKDKNPLEVRIRWSREDVPNWMTIIGVVGDVKQFGLDQPEEPAFYSLYEQLDQPWKRWMYLVVRSSESADSTLEKVKSRIWKADSLIPLTKVEMMRAVIGQSLAERRFNTVLLGIFACVALLLSSIGIYGLISYSVSQRTHEIGIRTALGASRTNVLRLILREGVVLAAAGLGLGLAGSVALTHLMNSLLYGVTATDPLTFVAVSGLLFAIGALAAMVPAVRAVRVDPISALRYE